MLGLVAFLKIKTFLLVEDLTTDGGSKLSFVKPYGRLEPDNSPQQ